MWIWLWHFDQWAQMSRHEQKFLASVDVETTNSVLNIDQPHQSSACLGWQTETGRVGTRLSRILSLGSASMQQVIFTRHSLALPPPWSSVDRTNPSSCWDTSISMRMGMLTGLAKAFRQSRKLGPEDPKVLPSTEASSHGPQCDDRDHPTQAQKPCGAKRHAPSC